MWIYQSESKELIDKKDSLKDIFLSFLRHNKETIVKLNGSEFTVNFYKDSSLHYFKSFFVVLNRDETSVGKLCPGEYPDHLTLFEKPQGEAEDFPTEYLHTFGL
jgi:hypothetical protein